MDLKQLEYIVKIDEECNITHAAEKLFITQSALNQQLLKLEKELGTPLFYRSRTDWHPTPAGEIYLAAARDILNIKKETYNRIHDIAQHKKGTLSVGLTAGRGIEMFSHVYPEFHRSHFFIQVTPFELSVKEQQALITSGDLDIGFLTYDETYRSPNICEVISVEELFFVIPKFHPYAVNAAPKGQPFAIGDLYALREEPFVLMYKKSTISNMVDNLFHSAGFKPDVLFETGNFNTIVSMIKSGLCCGILPYYYIRDNLDNLACFAFPSHPTWNIGISYRKDAYVSSAAKDFIELAKNYLTGRISHTL